MTEDKYKGIRNFGLPYQGSKNRIAKKIMEILPSGNRFVDLFCGGCSMTHCAILSGKYNSYLINDTNKIITQTFLEAINGKYKNEKRWISRKEFFELKDTDGYVRLSYSFGNNQRTYLYNPEIEPYKKACHYAIVYDDWTDFKRLCPEIYQVLYNALYGMPINTFEDVRNRKLSFYKSINAEVKKNISTNDNIFYNSIKNNHFRIQNLSRIANIQSLEKLNTPELKDNLILTNVSYEIYQYKIGDVVYCDPPYQNTEKYNKQNFDSDKFWDWVRKQPYPIYISEYNAPDDFVPILDIKKCKMMGGGKTASKKATEKVFIHQRFKI